MIELLSKIFAIWIAAGMGVVILWNIAKAMV